MTPRVWCFWHAALAVLLLVVVNVPSHAIPLEPLKRGRSGSSSLIPFPRVGRSVDHVLQLENQEDNMRDRSDGLSREDEVMRRSHVHSPTLYYGQKRTDATKTRQKRSADMDLAAAPSYELFEHHERSDRSNLPLPYPRLGKRASSGSPLFWNYYDSVGPKRGHEDMIIPMARIGRRSAWASPERDQRLVVARKNDMMIPMARIGRSYNSPGDVIIPMARIGKRYPFETEQYAYPIPMPRIG